ncbi:MAG: T9SS type A sorting domain-containing protein, partial [Ignavibacteriae bacterium]|nr:T9SS type A sorting domain-containing protein [Ignavibacteriota bacterium]
SFVLFNNYPNPFNPTTTISYFIPEPSSIKISIYNLLGEVVQISENNFINYGFHNYEFDASKLSSGVYVYSLEANSVISTNTFIDFKKMSILK